MNMATFPWQVDFNLVYLYPQCEKFSALQRNNEKAAYFYAAFLLFIYY